MQLFRHTIFLGILLLLVSCDPYIDDDIELPPLPGAPEFSVSILPEDPNKVVIEDLSEGFFSRVWELPSGFPNTSVKKRDTITYSKAGTYDITLHAAKEGGGGSSSAIQSVTIEQDIVVACDDFISRLTGGCLANGKTWVFSQEAGAISVGPDPYSTNWFSSSPGSLDPVQYEDSYTFFFDGNIFLYDNNGLTVDPCNGYEGLPYTPDENISWTLTPGAGVGGEPRITLPDGVFIGVRDSGPFYDIISLTETELVLHGPLKPCSPGTTGWFTLKFVKAD